MKLFRVVDYGWAVETEDGLFELESPWYHLQDNEPQLGPKIEGDVALRAPVDPTKIVCVGLNFQKHAEEQNKPVPEEPLLFMKPLTSISDPGWAVQLPAQSDEVHHEGELAVVIGRKLKGATAEEAAAGIFGYTCANDVTARDIQRREKRYTRAKGFDTFCPLGPCVVLAGDFTPSAHVLETRLNGEVKQHSRLDDFIFDVPTVVSFISEVMTLNVGDVILTGTPAGVGPIRRGDTVEVEIDGIGTLVSKVI